jgi:hypothetical protein
MAISKAQFYEKLKNWVPDWVFESENYQKAVFNSIAKILSSSFDEVLDFVDQTFIEDATQYTLDLHGSERSVTRIVGESDANYSLRIRNRAKALDRTTIEATVNSFLPSGACTVEEHDYDGTFCDRDYLVADNNPRKVFSDIDYDTFSIIVPQQTAGAPGQTVLDGIADAINASKALGTLYRIVELDI